MTAIPKVAKVLKEAGPVIGRPISRVDGPAKVTGAAKYAAEFNGAGLTCGYIINSAIARGHVITIDTADALAAPGVLHIFTHENRPSLAWFDKKWKDDDSPPGSPFRPLYDNEIHFSGQPIALVVAESFEQARYAASLVRVQYETAEHLTDLQEAQSKARPPRSGKGGYQPPPKPRGDADQALAGAAHRVDVEYHASAEHHNPMEMFASTIIVEPDGTFTVYDKTQGAINSQTYVCNVFGLSKAEVRVISPFVGGAFGSGLRPQHQLFMAMLAAIELKRSVRVSMTRPQMFTFGHRPETVFKLSLGASAEGKLTAIKHTAIAETSQFEDYCEIVVNWSGEAYQCENVTLDYKVAPIDVYTPLDMRAPGAVWGMYALECAIDELAAKLGTDPLSFREQNYAELDQNTGKKFSSKELRACYRQGAERFGWAKRNVATRSMRDGRKLVGWGMATGIWDALSGQAAAKAVFSVGNKLAVSSATADIGTGTYTIMTQIAADVLGLPIENVNFRLGDSSLPMAPIEGGSWTAATVGPAVKLACDAIGAELLKLAGKMQDSPLADAKITDVEFAEETIRLKSNPQVAVSFQAILRASGVSAIEKEVKSIPNLAKQHPYTSRTHSAIFVEVTVDEDLGKVDVTRAVSAVAAGRILNPKTAGNQVMGAVVWGIGMALHEESMLDNKLGRFMNHDIAEYHIPVNADIPNVDVIFVEEHDDIVNSLGVKGVGEIGIVGVAAAISNAVYHATGKRIRSLPITLDKVLMA